jgi:hypothetical protein
MAFQLHGHAWLVSIPFAFYVKANNQRNCTHMDIFFVENETREYDNKEENKNEKAEKKNIILLTS